MSDRRFARTPSNGCSACRQDFTSVEIFDRHRTGRHDLDWPEHEEGRRCLDVVEMAELGWRQDDKGRWLDPVRLERARERLSALGDTPQTREKAA